MAPVTAYGVVAILIGFLMVGITAVANWGDRPENLPALDMPTLPLAFCAIMYSYEGINLLLPIESAMKRPANFEKSFSLAMVIVLSVFTTFATLSVVAFGKIDDGSITAYLMMNNDQYHGEGYVLVANIIVSLSVLLTYPLQILLLLGSVGRSDDVSFFGSNR